MTVEYINLMHIQCLSTDTKPSTGISPGTLCKVITKATTPTGVDTAVWYKWTGAAWILLFGVDDAATLTGALTYSGASVAGLLSQGSTYRENFGHIQSETLIDNKTLDEGDSGVLQIMTVTNKTITLPATVLGYSYTVMNGGADGAVLVKIAPNANDKIMGNGYTAANNKYVANTAATAKKGDYIKLVGDGADGWFITEVVGTWAKEA